MITCVIAADGDETVRLHRGLKYGRWLSSHGWRAVGHWTERRDSQNHSKKRSLKTRGPVSNDADGHKRLVLLMRAQTLAIWNTTRSVKSLCVGRASQRLALARVPVEVILPDVYITCNAKSLFVAHTVKKI